MAENTNNGSSVDFMTPLSIIAAIQAAIVISLEEARETATVQAAFLFYSLIIIGVIFVRHAMGKEVFFSRVTERGAVRKHGIFDWGFALLGLVCLMIVATAFMVVFYVKAMPN